MGAALDGPKLRTFRRRERLSQMGPRGFWRYAAERLFVLEEYMRRAGMPRCLHVESDNLVFPELLTAGSRGALDHHLGSSVAACPLTEDEDTAAVLYVGSIDALGRVTDALLDLASMRPEHFLQVHGGQMFNEMRMLAVLREWGLTRSLPTSPAEPLARSLGLVFDPASYGQWLDGTHSVPGTAFASDLHILGPALRSGNLIADVRPGADHGEVRLRGETGLPLANIHVHSKRLAMWAALGWDAISPDLLTTARRPSVRHSWRTRRDARAVSSWRQVRLGIRGRLASRGR
jgi:hypothetical protein